MLAEVGWLRTLCTCIPVYAKLVQSVQDLSTAMHKFHKHFNDQVGQMVMQLEATKGQMEKARVRARIQQELSELVQNRELRGKLYWPGLLGIPEHPNRHYLPLLLSTYTVTNQNTNTGEAGSGAKRPQCRGCTSSEYRATQRVYNVCRLCQKRGHWLRECKEPHSACKGPYCQLRKGHPSFDKQDCRFPKRQMGQRGLGKCKCEEDSDAPQQDFIKDNEEIDMLIN